jgi:hypothetical protein
VADCFSYRRHAFRILVALTVLQAGYARAGTSEWTARAVLDRQQVNESCSEQADALGLHDQERWDFRARCKVRKIAEYCSEQADALGLHGEARWTYRAGCKS